MRVQTAPPEHYAWIAERAQLIIGPNFVACEAVDDSGRIHGMIGFDGFLPNAVSMHIALENPASFRHLVGPAFWFVFNEAKREIATCTVLSSNARSLRLVGKVGFREVFRGRNWWAPDVDLVFFEMKRAACRWIRPAQKERQRWAA